MRGRFIFDNLVEAQTSIYAFTLTVINLPICCREERQDHPPPQVRLQADQDGQAAQEGPAQGHLRAVQGAEAAARRQLPADAAGADVLSASWIFDPWPRVQEQGPDELDAPAAARPERHDRRQGDEEVKSAHHLPMGEPSLKDDHVILLFISNP